MRKKITLYRGKNINFKEAVEGDAKFILSLRLDKKLSRFLHPVKNDIKKQQDWIRQYKKLNNTYYFIIEGKKSEPYGVFRIYDITQKSFCLGSWIIRDNAPVYIAIESFLLAHDIGFYELGLDESRFYVRKDNFRVVEFYKRFGCRIIKNDGLNCHFSLSKEEFERSKARYKRYSAQKVILSDEKKKKKDGH